MAKTFDEFVTQVTAEVESEKPMMMTNGNEITEFTDADYDWIINLRAQELFNEQENGWLWARQEAYGAISDQLDQLYWDIDAGKLDKTGEWYKAIKKVKTDNPKPS